MNYEQCILLCWATRLPKHKARLLCIANNSIMRKRSLVKSKEEEEDDIGTWHSQHE